MVGATSIVGSNPTTTPKNAISMNRYQIENLMQTLAMSQGMYGRMLDQIYSAPEDEQETFWENMEAQGFSDPLDVVLFLEG